MEEKMRNTVKQKLITLVQLLFVLIFIVFEEIIWEGIAKPFYTWVHSLKALEKIEAWLQKVNATAILVIFVLMLVFVELLGIYAGVLFVSGKLLLGITIYASKIPIAAFTFWMFRVTEEKLMQFGWFRWIYEKTMIAIDWLKSLEIYQNTMKRLKKTKEHFRVFKRKYFSQDSPFIAKMKKLYSGIKQVLKR
ncbi:hypothetical protein [Sulfurovum indicum]|nr:hypothetical protein [Sulfurovum indicum]